MGMPAFAPFFEALDNRERVSELKKIYADLRATLEDLPPPGTKDGMIKAIRAYEQGHPDQCEAIPSEDEF